MEGCVGLGAFAAHAGSHMVPCLCCWLSAAGQEVGFIAGCVRAWRQLAVRDNAMIPARAERSIAALEQQLAAFPLCNPQASAPLLTRS